MTPRFFTSRVLLPAIGSLALVVAGIYLYSPGPNGAVGDGGWTSNAGWPMPIITTTHPGFIANQTAVTSVQWGSLVLDFAVFYVVVAGLIYLSQLLAPNQASRK